MTPELRREIAADARARDLAVLDRCAALVFPVRVQTWEHGSPDSSGYTSATWAIGTGAVSEAEAARRPGAFRGLAAGGQTTVATGAPGWVLLSTRPDDEEHASLSSLESAVAEQFCRAFGEPLRPTP